MRTIEAFRNSRDAVEAALAADEARRALRRLRAKRAVLREVRVGMIMDDLGHHHAEDRAHARERAAAETVVAICKLRERAATYAADAVVDAAVAVSTDLGRFF